MIRTYVKPTSYTQQACSHAAETVKQITDRLQISRNEWLHMLFENGCLMAEAKVNDEVYRQQLLTDVSYGYWAWWMSMYVQHDAQLLAAHYTRWGSLEYANSKERLINRADIDLRPETFLNK